MPHDSERFFENTVLDFKDKYNVDFEFRVVNTDYIRDILYEIDDIEILEQISATLRIKGMIDFNAITETIITDLIIGISGNLNEKSDGPSGSRETAGYAINLDVEKNIITARHIGTDEEILLTREPFEQEEIINTIFIRDGWCYYVTKIVDVEW